MDYTNLEANQEVSEEGLIYDLGSLYDYLNRIEDTRSKYGKQYPLTLLLIWMIIAKLSGEDKPSGIAEWVAHRKALWIEYQLTDKMRTPSHMTYRRVLQEILNPEEFERLMEEYHQQRLIQEEEMVLSMDGKTVRGTIPRGEIRGIYLLAIYVPQQGLVLAQAEVDRKENEIVVAPRVLRQVNLVGNILVADAMHTQKEMCSYILSEGGDYVLTAKNNQAHTLWAIEKLFIHRLPDSSQG